MSQGNQTRRFQDKTDAELEWENNKKKKMQFRKLVNLRYYQLGFLVGSVFFYMFVYTKYLEPKPVSETVSYSQAQKYLSNNPIVRKELGSQFQFMCCNGQVYPYKNDIDFAVILYGTRQNARVNIKSIYNVDKGSFIIKTMNLVLRKRVIPLI